MVTHHEIMRRLRRNGRPFLFSADHFGVQKLDDDDVTYIDKTCTFTQSKIDWRNTTINIVFLFLAAIYVAFAVALKGPHDVLLWSIPLAWWFLFILFFWVKHDLKRQYY